MSLFQNMFGADKTTPPHATPAHLDERSLTRAELFLETCLWVKPWVDWSRAAIETAVSQAFLRHVDDEVNVFTVRTIVHEVLSAKRPGHRLDSLHKI